MNPHKPRREIRNTLEAFIAESNRRIARSERDARRLNEEQGVNHIEESLLNALNGAMHTFAQELEHQFEAIEMEELQHNRNNDPFHVNPPPPPLDRLRNLNLPAQERRPVSWFRRFIRNILMFDYLLMVMLFPFSIYNLIKSGFNCITFSESDFLWDILFYFRFVGPTLVPTNMNIRITDEEDIVTFGLLGTFHNVVIYYTEPLLRRIVRFHNHKWLIRMYSIMVKIVTACLYLTYGLSGTTYLLLASFFFSLVMGWTLMRRYRACLLYTSRCV